MSAAATEFSPFYSHFIEFDDQLLVFKATMNLQVDTKVHIYDPSAPFGKMSSNKIK